MGLLPTGGGECARTRSTFFKAGFLAGSSTGTLAYLGDDESTWSAPPASDSKIGLEISKLPRLPFLGKFLPFAPALLLSSVELEEPNLNELRTNGIAAANLENAEVLPNGDSFFTGGLCGSPLLFPLPPP